MTKINEITKRKYENLKVKYETLKNKYNEIKSKKTNFFMALMTYLLGIVCLIKYRYPIVTEAGILLMLVGLFVELKGTKKGNWNYADSFYMISGRVPIEIALQYFFIGVIGASYYFFRTQTFTSFIF